jgi:hypothetical protein
MRKTTKNVSQKSQYLEPDPKPETLKYETEVQTTQPQTYNKQVSVAWLLLRDFGPYGIVFLNML